MSAHPIVHIELSTTNHEASSNFYSAVFGWKMTRDEAMNYSMFEYAENQGGGFNPVSDDNPVGNIMLYIQTDDIEATLERIEAHGGKTLLPKTEIPNTGWFAFFQDPTGNNMAIYKSMNP